MCFDRDHAGHAGGQENPEGVLGATQKRVLVIDNGDAVQAASQSSADYPYRDLQTLAGEVQGNAEGPDAESFCRAFVRDLRLCDVETWLYSVGRV